MGLKLICLIGIVLFIVSYLSVLEYAKSQEDQLLPLYVLNETTITDQNMKLYHGISQRLDTTSFIKSKDDYSPSYEISDNLGFIYKNQKNGTIPLYELEACCCAFDYCYTTDENEIKYAKGSYELTRTIGYIFPSQQNGTIPIYRYDIGGDGYYRDSDWDRDGNFTREVEDPCSHHLIGTKEKHTGIIGFIPANYK
jgi:hypothetical protein